MARSDRNSYTIEDYYQSYKEYTKDNPLYKISKAKFRNILKDYFKFLASEIIDGAKEVRLPARMGTLYVIKIKPKKFGFNHCRVDFYNTKEYNKTIFHLNEHSDGYKYMFRWRKFDILIKHKSLYELIMTRDNKRRLAKIIKNKEKDYIEN